MNARRRLAASLGAALLLVIAMLALLPRWPLEERDAAVEETSEAAGRQARIEALRTEIERELRRLQAVRAEQESARAELRALERSLEHSRERIDQLRREVESRDGT